jgi:catechol 2,3-dioxygenase-like lactoylglutathione lyase family enzyme
MGRENMGDEVLLGWPTWIGVVVDDLEGQRRFWGRLLGVPEDHSGPDFVDFELGEGRSFELIKRSDSPEYDGLRFQVGFEVEDIEVAHRELVRLGVKPIGGIVEDDAGAPWAYFRDPEGNVFEIKQQLDEPV